MVGMVVIVIMCKSNTNIKLSKLCYSYMLLRLCYYGFQDQLNKIQDPDSDHKM